MDLKLFTAVAASKGLKAVIRVFGGGATAAPGLLAERIDPLALGKLSNRYDTTILVTGTNGKTTTSRLLGTMLSENKIAYIHNRSGSNLLRGIIGTLVENVKIGQNNKNVAVFEVDEVTLPHVIKQTDPKILLFNNLFRDQLDRYGEVDKIRKVWKKSLSHLDSSSVIIINTDDHSVAHLAESTRARVVYFGIEDKEVSIGKLPHASDFTSCISCGSELDFDEVYLAHLGKYKCKKCGLTRPKPDIYAEKIELDSTNGFTAMIQTPSGKFTVTTKLPGIYNVYNTLAAISAGLVFGLSLKSIGVSLKGAAPAFGRTEKIEAKGKKIFVGLVKNPAGFNEILRTLFQNKTKKYALIAINDLIADGKDVSWLWDVDFEFFSNRFKKLWVAGFRANDLALRMKYTGSRFPTEIEENVGIALDKALKELPEDETLYILPTYTAMLKIKKLLAEIGISKNFWED